MVRLSLILVLGFFEFFCIGQEQSENLSKIQSAASLLYHLEHIENKNSIDIDFNKSQVENLWDDLSDENAVKAYEAYLEKDYAQSRQLLENLWRSWIEDELNSDVKAQATSIFYNDVDQNPYISAKIFNEIFPYLLPFEHPARPNLDLIFQTSRATFNKDSLKNAGFNILYSQPRSFIKVVEHAYLPNYLLKLYIDIDSRKKNNKPGWTWFVRRCEGAEKIRKILKKYNVLYFSVPHKWIYPLPIDPPPPQDVPVERQIVVLLVDDMHLAPKEENLAAWKTRITKKHLDELYLIISLGNGSSYRADNVPLTKGGKFAFIDTEYPHRPPNFATIRPYLSTKMRAYWDSLVKKGGKIK